jgi:hypothetical protein
MVDGLGNNLGFDLSDKIIQIVFTKLHVTTEE